MTDPWPDHHLIKPDELAQEIKVTVHTVYSLIRRGEVKSVRVRGRNMCRIPKAEALRVMGFIEGESSCGMIPLSEFLEIFHCSPKVARTMISKGKLRVVKFARTSCWVPQTEVDRLLQAAGPPVSMADVTSGRVSL